MATANPVAKSIRTLRNLLAVLFVTASALAAPVSFNIPAQPAAGALDEFIRQSKVQVFYVVDDVKDIRTNEVSGTLELSDAMAALLKNTGLSFKRNSKGWFTITKDATAKTGSIEGTLLPPPNARGRGLDGVTISIAQTGQASTLDKYGRFRFDDVSPGTYMLVASGSGYSRLRITDVVVEAGHSVTISPQPMALVMRDGEVQMMEEVVVSARKDVEVMEKYVVTDAGATKPAPFATSNFDLPRSIDDIQPYYMWDSSQLDRSGAANVQDFFQKMVPMNTSTITANQSNSRTDLSNINLNGLGSNGFTNTGAQNTLILVDGLPLPMSSYSGSISQANVNGLPLSAIDHIEVLPSSAAAIYGANATGGVVNIVLKHDYAGGELSWDYNNTFSSDNSNRTLSLTLGQSLEGGKTSILLTATYQTRTPLLIQDRTQLIEPYVSRSLSVYPGGKLAYLGILTSTGAIPTSSAGVYLNTPFVRSANNTPLIPGTTATQLEIPAGYQNSLASGLSPLQANIGKYDLSRPNNNGSGGLFGSRYPILNGPRVKGLNLLAHRQMTPWLELFAQVVTNSEFYLLPSSNETFSVSVPATVPGNPFGQAVTVSVGNAGPMPYFEYSNTVSRSFSGGAKFSLPHNWKAELDYTWGATTLSVYENILDSTALQTAVTNGLINVIGDLGLYPPNLPSVTGSYNANGLSSLDSLHFKAAGQLARLWAGAPSLAAGVSTQMNGAEGDTTFTGYPDRAATGYGTSTSVVGTQNYHPGQKESHQSGYVELDAPLVAKANGIFGIRELELQAVGRWDGFEEHTTSPGSVTVNTLASGAYTTSPNLLNGQLEPIRSNPASKYSKMTGTVGFKYHPVDDLFFRWSFSTGYDVPTFTQLQAPVSTGTISEPTTPASQVNPAVPTTSPWGYQAVTDPVLNATYFVPVETGGNPNLVPETSRGIDWGVVFEPSFLRGLRVSVDYTRIAKYNNIVGPSAALLLQYASQFPGRIQRTGPGGPIVLIDATNINAPEAYSSSYNVEVDYTWNSASTGVWKFTGVANSWQHYAIQSTIGGPFVEQVANPSTSTFSGFGFGAGLPKFKGNLGLDWSKGSFFAGWTAQYVGPYTRGSYEGISPNGTPGPLGYFTVSTNGWIPGQIYHDVYLGYKFGPAAKTDAWWLRALSRTTLRLGVDNLFNHFPPLDAVGTYYAASYFGDGRLARYILNVKKSF
jgi:outer membrane receptor protein involved in Fe transport